MDIVSIKIHSHEILSATQISLHRKPEKSIRLLVFNTASVASVVYSTDSMVTG